MGGDSRFDILREVGIDSRRGTRAHQGDALGNLASCRFRRAEDGYGLGVALDDDLSPGFDLFEDRPYIPGQVAFADVQRFHTCDDSVSSASLSYTPETGDTRFWECRLKAVGVPPLTPRR